MLNIKWYCSSSWWLTRSYDLFQDIPSELLSQISQISKAKDYESGEVIFNEGDYGDSMFIVIEGEVSIQKNGNNPITFEVIIFNLKEMPLKQIQVFLIITPQLMQCTW